MKNRISVLITAHNRKQYLAEAINSVINQKGIDKKDYEIIVLKNFKDKKIDNLIKKNKIVELYHNGYLGEKIAIGIKHAKNNIICILEDDDLFLENRLKIVKSAFDSIPDLIYYHNQNFEILSDYINYSELKFRKIGIKYNGKNQKLDINGITIYCTKSNMANRIIHIDKNTNLQKDGRLWAGNSSTSFKNYFSKKELAKLSKIKISADLFISITATKRYSSKIFIDNKKLTIYRIHNENTTALKEPTYLGYIKNRKKFLFLYLQDSKTIYKWIGVQTKLDLINEIEYKIWCNKLQIDDIPKMIKAGMWKHLFYFINKGFLKRKMYETQMEKIESTNLINQNRN